MSSLSNSLSGNLSSSRISRKKGEGERLYNLLPAVYRQKETVSSTSRKEDEVSGEPLRALMAIIEEQMCAIESDIQGLYENWFIETCQEWVLPYIGDLLGMRHLRLSGSGSFGERAHVANTQRYRRRKGTAFVLEQAARDASGWPVRTREFFSLVVSTQNLNHIRPSALATVDLKNAGSIELLGGPFEDAAHLAEVGMISNGHSRYNIKNIGLFFWRLDSFAVSRGNARKSVDGEGRRFWFSPLGIDMPLFNRPQAEHDIVHLAEEFNVPGRLRRRALFDEISSRRSSLLNNKEIIGTYFGEYPVFRIFLDDEEVKPEEMMICSLEKWEKEDCSPPKEAVDREKSCNYRVAVDPELGRLVLLSGLSMAKEKKEENATEVLVSYSYGFSSEIGAGAYSRIDDMSKWIDFPGWQRLRSDRLTTENGIFVYEVSRQEMSLKDAISTWKDEASKSSKGTIGIIFISDSSSTGLGSGEAICIKMPEGSKLAIVAAVWPKSDDGERLIDELEPDGLLPHIFADLEIEGDATSELILDGLLIEGCIEVKSSIGRLRLSDCTIVPRSGGLAVHEEADGCSIEMQSCICGPVDIKSSFSRLKICESIIDGQGIAISAGNTVVEVQACTVLGKTIAHFIQAGSSIFTGDVSVKRWQTGCMRFCYLPSDQSSSIDLPDSSDSITPRRYRCQPDRALKEAQTPEQRESIRKTLAPAFSSLHFGHPGYCQLSSGTPDEILKGSEDESEMGVFSGVKRQQREADLLDCMDEYLPLSLNFGIFYVD